MKRTPTLLALLTVLAAAQCPVEPASAVAFKQCELRAAAGQRRDGGFVDDTLVVRARERDLLGRLTRARRRDQPQFRRGACHRIESQSGGSTTRSVTG